MLSSPSPTRQRRSWGFPAPVAPVMVARRRMVWQALENGAEAPAAGAVERGEEGVAAVKVATG